VRRLGLKSQAYWREYCKSGKRPADIPAWPPRVYAEAGWTGWGDWLGTENVASRLRKYKSFTNAGTFVRRLGLKSQAEWFDYSRSGKKPYDIPTTPHIVYAESGWSGWGDWLGTGTVAPRLRQYRSFKKARPFARRLGLKSEAEWFDYCKSGKKPADIPAAAPRAYADAGWSGFGDWLGYARKR
jgi:hypothetical protein